MTGLIGREQWIIAASLAMVAILAWLYILMGAGMDMSMPGMVMAPMAWTSASAALMLVMWWVMMIAMMIPSAAPAILLFARIQAGKTTGTGRRSAPRLHRRLPCRLGGFQCCRDRVASGARRRWAAGHGHALVQPGARRGDPAGGWPLPVRAGQGGVPAAVPESPLFLTAHWRPGTVGAFQMGARHGVSCLGCCWVLMALLFAGGVMNLLWVAGLAVYVGYEKLVGGAGWTPGATGAILCVAGLVLLSGVLT